MPRGAVKEKKKGLHGWRAFLVVFASGTIAAFLVMGLIVGVLRMFVSTVNSGLDGGAQPPEGVGAPQAGDPLSTVPPGKLNICDRTLKTMSKLSVSRVDDDDDYRDDALEGEEGGGRTVSDDCEWKLTPEFTSIEPWEFEFTYEAILDSDEGGDRDSAAGEIFEEWKSGIPDEFGEVREEGEEDLSDRGYVVYGVPVEGDGHTAMVALVQTRSAVYKISLSGKAGEEMIPRGAFEHEMSKMLNRLDQDFRLRIPE